jgi:hypothetical protein
MVQDRLKIKKLRAGEADTGCGSQAHAVGWCCAARSAATRVTCMRACVPVHRRHNARRHAQSPDAAQLRCVQGLWAGLRRRRASRGRCPGVLAASCLLFRASGRCPAAPLAPCACVCARACCRAAPPAPQVFKYMNEEGLPDESCMLYSATVRPLCLGAHFVANVCVRNARTAPARRRMHLMHRSAAMLAPCRCHRVEHTTCVLGGRTTRCSRRRAAQSARRGPSA